MSNEQAQAQINIEFRSYWLAGTGGGHGRHLDAACYRDSDGLPAIPMSQIKGTLRQTAERLAATKAASWSQETVNLLFGERTEDGGEGEAGVLQFIGDAMIADPQRDFFKQYAAVLFERLPATKLNDDEVAEDRTLRFAEGVVPLSLKGSIVWEGEEPVLNNWVDLLDSAAAATLAFGKNKNDGYGKAIAEVEECKSPNAASSSVPMDISRSRKVHLILEQNLSVIFSESSATEGAHKSVSAPTGASLLGWCAAKGSYLKFDDCLNMFHTGAVKFGNAAPISEDGSHCLPFPRNLFAPKEDVAKISAGGQLNSEIVRVGSPAQGEADDTQFEALKGAFLSSNIEVVNIPKGQRLRTATNEGRAKPSQLFGYQHLSAVGQTRYVAEIEASTSISDDDWNRLLKTFSGKTLRLGRAKGTGYGGEFACSILPVPDEKQRYQSEPATDRIRILALSDLALVNEFGCSTCQPTAEHFNLSDYHSFDSRDSVISVRRFAPWNGKLKSRDIERQIIEAGSVISFKIKANTDQSADNETNANLDVGLRNVGIWRETGFGKVWVNPKFLTGEKLIAQLLAGSLSTNLLNTEEEISTNDVQSTMDENITAWIERRHTLRKGVA